MEKSWLWQNERTTGVEGAVIDFDENRVQWFDEPGCACAGSTMEQTLNDFRERGPRYIMPPEDVLQEMHDAIQQVLST